MGEKGNALDALELMNIGIVVDRIDFFKLGGDFAAFLYEIDAI